MVALGWVVNAYAASLGDAVSRRGASSGIGGGAIYATCVGHAVKWFPDRRGLAGRPDRGGLRRRRGDQRHADPRGDRFRRITRPLSSGSASSRAASFSCWRGCCAGRKPVNWPATAAPKVVQSATQLYAAGSADEPDLLAALRHVRHGVGVGPDGDRADRADRQGLQRWRQHRVLGRDDADRGADHRQCRQRRGASAVRLDFRSHRPRIHDGDRVRSGRRCLLAAR